MASSEESNTAATAEQLGNMSLGDSAERKDNDTEPSAKNGTQTKLCSACGKESDTAKKCTACKCVWYCDKDCQKSHRKEHKKDCKRIKKELFLRCGKLNYGTELELDVGPLGKLPPQEECPICMRVLPLQTMLQSFFSCCGKTVCGGCNIQHQIKSHRHRVERGLTPVLPTCAFCRTTLPKPDEPEEVLARYGKRVKLKDPNALRNMAMNHGYGLHGLPVDQAKCIEFLHESAGLGCPIAQYQLGNFHDAGEMGLVQNREEGLKYWKNAAEGGPLVARHNIGCVEASRGDIVAAIRHWRLSASGGEKDSMRCLIVRFEAGLFHHGDLAETLQAMYRARAEMKSEDRDQYIEYLKRTGEYEAEYDS